MDKNRRTIDGLKPREAGVPRRQLGFPEGRAAKYAGRHAALAGKKIDVKQIEELPGIEPERKDEIAEFLAEVRDDDPTNLFDSTRSKRQKREKPTKKEHKSHKWWVLAPIIVILVTVAATILVVELGWWNVQEKMMAGDTSFPVIFAAALNIVWNIGELAVIRWVMAVLIVGLVVLAAWNGKKVLGKKKWVVILCGTLVTIVALTGIVAWKGVSIWNQLNDALSAMTGGRVDIGSIQEADPTVPLKEDANGRTNVLVYGTSGYEMDSSTHDGFRLADTILVISLDQDAGDVKTLSIPRDLYSEKRCTATGKMNETYFCEYQKMMQDPRYREVQNNPEELAKLRWEYEEKAAENFSAVVGEITGLDIQYWAHINWGAVISIVDALGGLDVAIEYEGNRDSYVGDLPVIWTNDPRGIKDNIINFKAGTVVHLDGATALELGRARNSNTNSLGQYGIDNNWGREKIQQALIEAISTKTKTTNFVSNLDSALKIIQSLGDNLRMNFDAEGIRRGIHLAGVLDVTGMKSIDLKSLFTTTMLDGRSYVVPRAGTFDYTSLAEFITDELKANPLEEEGGTVDVLNGTDQVGLATKVSNELRDAGFDIATVGDAQGEMYAKTVIYRVAGGKMPATEQALLERFGVDTVRTSALPEGVMSEANFVVILGEN